MEKWEKLRPIKNTWYDCLINYIPDSIKKCVGDFKEKLLVFLRHIYLSKQCIGKPKQQNKIRNPSILKKKLKAE